MLKSIFVGTVTYGMAKLINEMLLNNICDSKKKEFEYAVKKYQNALEKWKEEKDKLFLEKPKKELENFEEALVEWKTKVKELYLKEPKITDYNPTNEKYRVTISAICGALAGFVF